MAFYHRGEFDPSSLYPSTMNTVNFSPENVTRITYNIVTKERILTFSNYTVTYTTDRPMLGDVIIDPYAHVSN
jgi:hypothetical protein